MDLVLNGGVHGSTFLVLRQIDVMRELGCHSAYSNAYPLHAAAAAGNASSVRQLLEDGFVATQRTIAEKRHAMRDEQLPWLRILPNFGALESVLGVSGEIGQGQTPLHRAGSVEVVRILVKAGADVDVPDAVGKTPLLRAYLTGYMRDILHRQALRDQRKPLPSWTDYDPPVVAALIAAKADVKHRDNEGRSLVHYAALLGRPQSNRTMHRCRS